MKYQITHQKNNTIITDIIETDFTSLPSKIEEFQNIIKIKQLNNKKYKLHLENHKQEIYLLFKQIHLMLESHLNFNEALDLILQSNKSEYIKNIIKIMQRATTQNYPIDDALRDYEKSMGRLPIIFLKQGIQNGTVKDSIGSIVTLLEKEITIKKRLLQTLQYPFLLLLSLAISFAMIFIYVVPNFEFIFISLGDHLPFATELLLVFNNQVQNYWYMWILFLLSGFLSVLFIRYRYKFHFDKIVLNFIPIFSRVILEYQLYKLFLSLYVVVQSKYKFQTAITDSIQTITNLDLKNNMEQIEQRIKNGEEIADAFKNHKLFDQIVIKLLYTAQSTSYYERVLLDITNYYQQSFEERLQRFIALIEPFIILVIAVIILWMILAIMVPIWQLGAVGL